jgi:uncharacterized protein YdaU (DUF1376 family)
MWLQGARLPNDPKRLGRIVNASNAHWHRIWPQLQPFFTVSEDGKWLMQKRMSEEFEKACERKERQREGGRKSAMTGAKVAAMTGAEMSAMDGRNPLKDKLVYQVSPPTTRAGAKQEAGSSKDKNEALLKGASSYPVASDVPSGASSAREPDDPNRPADPNCLMLLTAEAEQIEQYRRARHVREKLEAAGILNGVPKLRLMP